MWNDALFPWIPNVILLLIINKVQYSHSSFSIIHAKLLQDPASTNRKEPKNKNSYPYWRLNLWPRDHQSNALLTVLASNLLVACVNHSAFIKSCSADSYSEQSSTCQVVHETNKAHFRTLLPNRFLTSIVSKALDWWSGGHRFNPQ